MAISYVGEGAFDSGTTSCLSNYVSGAATDAILTLIGSKPFGTAPSVSGYTGLGAITSGSVANGNGTGSTRATAGLRQSVPTSSGSDTVSVASGSPTMAIGLRFALGSGASWSVLGFGLSDTDESLVTVSASATIASGAITVNDWLVISVVLKDDAINHTTQLLTISGVTHGAITWLAKQSTTSGNDGAMYIGYCTVTAGASNGGSGTYSATSSVTGASAAAVNVIRLREVTSTPTGLAATSVSESRIDLSWSTVSGATSYTLERSLDGSTGWSTVYTGSTASYSDTGLASGTVYFYRVSATSSLGTSDPSSNVSTATWVTLPFTETFAIGSWARWVGSPVSGGTATVSSGAGVLSSPSSGEYARESLRVASQSAQGVLLKVTPTTGTAPCAIWMRADAWDAAGDPSNGVGLYVGTGGSFGFRYAVAGAVTSRGFTPQDAGGGLNSMSTGTAYYVRFEAVGTTYRRRIWLTTDPEPTGWDVMNTPSTVPDSGTLFMSQGASGAGSPGTSTVDDITYYVPQLPPTGLLKPGRAGVGLRAPQAVATGVR